MTVKLTVLAEGVSRKASRTTLAATDPGVKSDEWEEEQSFAEAAKRKATHERSYRDHIREVYDDE